MKNFFLFLAVTLLIAPCFAADLSVTPISTVDQSNLHPLPMRAVGRVLRHGDSFERQWPGTYFEAEIEGGDTYLKLGAGEVALKVTVDHDNVTLVKPAPGLYRIEGLKPGRHLVRVDVISESQAETTTFGGLYGVVRTRARATGAHRRQIEFIGDSHTVGYGNTSPTRQCTEAEVWATTDSSQGVAPLVARHYNADYQVNAISGRGIVRNYNGFPGDTLPQAYPYVLFKHDTFYKDDHWHPQALVISLGTNDFSTPLHDGEKWKTRDELRADFEKTYVEFLKQLRAKHPGTLIVLWATDMADGEIATEVQRVADKLRATGERKIMCVPLNGLEFSACNSHPSLADDRKIAEAVRAAIHAGVKNWEK
jgi:lysophospholipase L1-like esterase